jgi:hypothetical protein
MFYVNAAHAYVALGRPVVNEIAEACAAADLIGRERNAALLFEAYDNAGHQGGVVRRPVNVALAAIQPAGSNDFLHHFPLAKILVAATCLLTTKTQRHQGIAESKKPQITQISQNENFATDKHRWPQII